MSTSEEIAQQQQRLKVLRYTLGVLLNQYAMKGAAEVSPGMLMDIAEKRATIAHTKAVLQQWGVPVAPHPDDEGPVGSGVPNPPRANPAPDGDPFEPYLRQLERQATIYLKSRGYERAGHETITLQGEDVPDEVIGRPLDPTLTFEPFFEGEIAFEAFLPDLERAATSSTFEEAFTRYAGRVLLLGGPGTGKTITLMAFVRDLARRRLAEPGAPLPIYLRISSWSHVWNPTWDEKYLPNLFEWLTKGFRDSSDKRMVERLIRDGQAILILDGLDELGKERSVSNRLPDTPGTMLAALSIATIATDRETAPERTTTPPPDQSGAKLVDTYDPRALFVRCIHEQIPEKANLVISSRIENYHQLKDRLRLNGAVQLQPLTDQQIQGYLSELTDLWEALQSNRALLDIARIPLLLYLFTVAYQDPSAQTRQLKGLSQGDLRDRIFAQYLEHRYSREEAKARDGNVRLPFTADHLLGLLEQLALANLDSGEEGLLDLDDLERVIESPDRCTDFAEFACVLHILVPADETRESFRFIHLLLRDFFAFQAATKILHGTDPEARRTAAAALVKLSSTDARAIDPLIGYVFSDSDQERRAQIVGAIAERAGAETVEVLIQALSDNYWLVRERAAIGLGHQHSPQSVTALLRTLNDDDADVRAAAAQSLGRLGDARAISGLAAHLDDEDEGIHFSPVGAVAADALVAFGAAARDALLGTLAQSEPTGRARAVAVLGKLGDSTLIPVLLSTTRDPSAPVRANALRALGTFGDPGIIDTLIACLTDQESSVVTAARQSLAQLGDHAFEPICAGLGHADPRIRVGLVPALAALDDRRAVTLLISCLVDPATDVRVAATATLGGMGDQQATAPLIDRLTDPSQDVRSGAIRALQQIGAVEAVEPLIACLNDPVTDIRVQVSEALGELEDTRAVQPLIGSLRRAIRTIHQIAIGVDGRRRGRRRGRIARAEIRAAATALGRLGDRRAVEPLLRCLKDRDADVRTAAITALGQLGDPRSIAPIITSLRADDLDWQVAASLAQLGSAHKDYFYAALANTVPEIRTSIISELSFDDDSDQGQLTDILLMLIDDTDRQVRITVIEKLGVYEVGQAVGHLASLVRESHHDIEQCRALFEALAAIRTDGAVGPIFGALLDSAADDVRVAALDQITDLGMLDDRRVDAALAQMRRSPRIDVRMAALKGLAGQLALLRQIDLDLADEMIVLLRDDVVDTLPDSSDARGRLFDALEEMVDAALPRRDSLRLFCRGLRSFINGENLAAYQLVKRARDAQPDRWYYHYWCAEIAASWLKQDLEQSVFDCRTAITLRPDVGFLFKKLGDILIELGRSQEAIDTFERGLQIEPGNPNLYHWRGRAYYAQQQYDLAVADFSHVIGFAPENWSGYHWRGTTYYKQQHYDLAIADLSRAIELQPDNGNNHYWRGLAYYEHRHYDLAIADLSRTIELQPDNGNNHYWRGLAYYDQQQYDMAIADLSRAIELQPDDGYNYYWRGLAYYERRQYELAVADFSRAIELRPDNEDNHYRRGLAYYQHRQYELAIADLSRAIELEPTDAHDYFWRGLASTIMEATDSALADFQQAEALLDRSEDTCIRERLAARIALLKHDADTARQHYATAAACCESSRLVIELHALEATARAFPDNSAIPAMIEWLSLQAQRPHPIAAGEES